MMTPGDGLHRDIRLEMHSKVQTQFASRRSAAGWIRKAFSRDSGSLGQRVRKGIALMIGITNAAWSLRRCTSVGSGARVRGRMRVENHGSMVIGKGLSVVSRWIPMELLAGERGRLEIGDAVWINFGAVIAANERVTIGDRVMIGQHCIVSDTDFPDMPHGEVSLPARAIEIGDDVWLAGRVTVRPGVRIGTGSIIIAGSIVERDIPAYVVAGGIPARPLRKLAQRPEHTAAPAPAPRMFGYLISDFKIDDLAAELRGSDLFPGVSAQIAPVGQVRQTLLSPAPAGAEDFAVVWTRPGTAVASFSRLAAFETVDIATLLAEVDEFCAVIEAAAPGYGSVFVPTWTQPNWERGLGILDSRTGGATLALTAMNLRLMQRLSSAPNVFVLNATRWFETIGAAAINARAWYLGNVAVTRPALAEAARDIRAALGALTAGPRTLLVLDLDDTLWGGLVSNVGWKALELGGTEGTGKAYVDFQTAVKDLKRRGVALGIVSKIDESVAREAIRSHPAMILREADFAGWKFNRGAMAGNIVDLAKDLNLSLKSVVFIDDNPAERARVREALPEVYVPDWPKDVLLFPSALRSLRCFDTAVPHPSP
jgi:HAD superfamily phosphatase (TIGR01681 family)